MIKSKEKRARKGIAAVGIAGLAGMIVTTIISMGFMAQSVTMPNRVFFSIFRMIYGNIRN